MDKKQLFAQLNEELEKAHITLEIICVGGYLLELNNIRGTQDIDAFYEDNATITQIIHDIGERNKANNDGEDWLNNSVANLNPTPPRHLCTTIFAYSNLTVLAPPLEYVIGMKMKSGRERDIADIGYILKELNAQSPNDIEKTVQEYGFDADMSLILSAFESAYGIQWVVQYLSEHASEL